MPLKPMPSEHKKAGFTLIELIITIIIMSFAAIIIIPYIAAVTHGPDPVLREKAIALGQAMMDEILSKRWDENTPNGGGPICTSESTNYLVDRATLDPACTFPGTGPVASAIGREAGELGGANLRANWDDVDDYFDLSEAGTGNIFDQNGAALPGTWAGFQRDVDVDYIASDEGNIDTSAALSAGTTAANSTDTKRIIVTVQSPLGETFKLVAVLCNL